MFVYNMWVWVRKKQTLRVNGCISHVFSSLVWSAALCVFECVYKSVYASLDMHYLPHYSCRPTTANGNSSLSSLARCWHCACVCACVHSCTGTFSFNSSLVNKSIEYTVYEVEPVLYFRELQIYLWPTMLKTFYFILFIADFKHCWNSPVGLSLVSQNTM